MSSSPPNSSAPTLTRPRTSPRSSSISPRRASVSASTARARAATRLAGLSRFDRSGRAAQQLDAELALELAHLVRQGRLGDVKLVRGAGEMAVARHGLEVAKLTNLQSETNI